MRVTYQDDERNAKVFFANHEVKYMLKELQDEFFKLLLKQDTTHKPEFPFYVMPCDTLTAKGKNGYDLKISDSFD